MDLKNEIADILMIEDHMYSRIHLFYYDREIEVSDETALWNIFQFEQDVELVYQKEQAPSKYIISDSDCRIIVRNKIVEIDNNYQIEGEEDCNEVELTKVSWKVSFLSLLDDVLGNVLGRFFGQFFGQFIWASFG